MIYISSDFHYGHSNIAGSNCSTWSKGYRGFNSVDEMNSAIIDSLSILKPDDELFFLGDWSFGGHQNIPLLRSHIPCKVYITLGNHDHNISKYLDLFQRINHVWEGSLNNKKFFFSHYAHRVWPKSHHGTIHCYGHSHSSIEDYGLSMDIGWDTCNYGHKKHTLYTIQEIIKIMEKRKIEFPDHHNEETT